MARDETREALELGEFLDSKGWRWSWMNEFTGGIHAGEDRYARLIDLVAGGFRAEEWFRTTVMPAVEKTFGERKAQ